MATSKKILKRIKTLVDSFEPDNLPRWDYYAVEELESILKDNGVSVEEGTDVRDKE